MKGKRRWLVIWLVIVALLAAGSLLVPAPEGEGESVQTAMRDAVLHDHNKVSLFGLKEVNPALVSALTLTAVLLAAAALIRVLVIPKFQYVPGRFQLLLEEAVGAFDGMARRASPHLNGFLGAYIFAAAAYIFFGTMMELLGLQVITTNGHSITMPAPLSDINAAIALGCLSYCVIVSGGARANGLRGVGHALKDFSLPISMGFRMFGALLSGLLVTELVYHYFYLSFGIPVLVGVMFTLLHALIQSYVLTMLTSMFYGEVASRH